MIDLSSFNRTILELKLIYIGIVKYPVFLLIAPYWNWNIIIQERYSSPNLSFNRTILELKPQNCDLCSFHICLLIAPYWNWNMNDWGFSMSVIRLLIAPYWNWNLKEIQDTKIKMPFNRTILELKLLLYDNVVNISVLLIAPYWNWNLKDDMISEIENTF